MVNYLHTYTTVVKHGIFNSPLIESVLCHCNVFPCCFKLGNIWFTNKRNRFVLDISNNYYFSKLISQSPKVVREQQGVQGISRYILCSWNLICYALSICKLAIIQETWCDFSLHKDEKACQENTWQR